jgi:hypothetical protein
VSRPDYQAPECPVAQPGRRLGLKDGPSNWHRIGLKIDPGHGEITAAVGEITVMVSCHSPVAFLIAKYRYSLALEDIE